MWEMGSEKKLFVCISHKVATILDFFLSFGPGELIKELSTQQLKNFRRIYCKSKSNFLY